MILKLVEKYFFTEIEEYLLCLERFCLGRSINYVTRSCRFDYAQCNSIKCKGIRGMGRVRFSTISMIEISYSKSRRMKRRNVYVIST